MEVHERMWMRLTGCLVLSTLLLVLRVGVAQERPNGTVVIPRTWDDAAVATHEVPLADSAASPRHVSSDYYYRIPVRPIYKGLSRLCARAASRPATWIG